MEYIKASNINFTHEQSSETLLENINFHINDQSKIGLVGHNGCGKTTLFNLILSQLGEYSKYNFEGNLYTKKNLSIFMAILNFFVDKFNKVL